MFNTPKTESIRLKHFTTRLDSHGVVSCANRLPAWRIDNRGNDSCRFDRIESNRQHFQPTLHSPPEVEIREIKTHEPSSFLKRGHNFSRFIRFVSNRSNRSWCTWRGCCKKCAVAGKVCKSSTHNVTTKTDFNFSLFHDARIQTGRISWYMLREQHFVSQLLLEKRQVTRVKNFRCNLSSASVRVSVDV